MFLFFSFHDPLRIGRLQESAVDSIIRGKNKAGPIGADMEDGHRALGP